MSFLNITDIKRRPTHPGEMLREDFMPDYDLTMDSLAEAIDVSPQVVHELLQEERGITPDIALRLARLFGNTPQFWLNAQQAVDLWDVLVVVKHDVARIRPLIVV